MKFKGTAVWLLALTPLLLGRPSSGETLNHGATEAPKTMQDLTCAGVPSGAVFIPSVSRVWAIRQGGNQVRLVLSNQAISCAAALSGATVLSAFGSELAQLSEATCSDGWTNEFGIRDAQPGVFDLAQVGLSPSEAITRVELEQSYGCSPASECHVRITGNSGIGQEVPGPDATLEIYSVTDECFSGRISDYKSLRVHPPPPDMNGVFIAEWCSAE